MQFTSGDGASQSSSASTSDAANLLGLVRHIWRHESGGRGEVYATAQWFYRPEDTHSGRLISHADNELFLSDARDANSAHAVVPIAITVAWGQQTVERAADTEDTASDASDGAAAVVSPRSDTAFICRSRYSEGAAGSYTEEGRAPRYMPLDASIVALLSARGATAQRDAESHAPKGCFVCGLDDHQSSIILRDGIIDAESGLECPGECVGGKRSGARGRFLRERAGDYSRRGIEHCILAY